MRPKKAATLPEPNHILVDALEAAAGCLRRLAVDQETTQGRLSTAAWWLKYLDEAGFVLVRDPRKPSGEREHDRRADG